MDLDSKCRPGCPSVWGKNRGRLTNRYVPPVTEPARWGLRRRLLDQLDRVHLARPTVRLFELLLATRSGLTRTPQVEDDLPLPPARLRAQVGPLHADATFFLESGRQQAKLIENALADNGASLDALESLLDFGCGCGRVLRHWARLPRARVCGCDTDSRMVAWCDDNLPFAEVTLNSNSPPLSYEPVTFDLVYAFSVFTHLSEESQYAWISECRRVLRPGGYVLLSTLGEYYASLDRLSEAERKAFSDGQLVVLYESASGTSLCSAYHPPEYVRTRVAARFEYVSFMPAADDGRHDLHLLRKPAADE
jgi:SAM-dependent methyltransferase